MDALTRIDALTILVTGVLIVSVIVFVVSIESFWHNEASHREWQEEQRRRSQQDNS